MGMAFKYSCFISYCHGQYELTKGFIEQLKQALKAELEPLLDEEVYIDEERLKPGYRYNEALAKAICQSICMIVVYSPRYERHEYCGREFAGMEILEQTRRQMLGQVVPASGFIIPVIFRGEADLPPRITQGRHYADFSQFTLATANISRNPQYVTEIRKIAQVIYERYQAFEAAAADACAPCATFLLPNASAVPPWRDRPKPVSAIFPGREGSP
jgi:hypothetical protein